MILVLSVPTFKYTEEPEQRNTAWRKNYNNIYDINRCYFIIIKIETCQNKKYLCHKKTVMLSKYKTQIQKKK